VGCRCPASLGVNVFHQKDRASCNVRVTVQNLERVYPFKSYGGSKLLNSGHVTLTTPTLWGNLTSDGKYLTNII